MTTIAAGNHQQIYFDHLDDIVITPGSGGTVKFDCSTPNSAATRPTARIIYSETSISIPAGSTVFLDAVGADATYDRYTYPSRSSLESAYPADANEGLSSSVDDVPYDAVAGSWFKRFRDVGGLVNVALFGDSNTSAMNNASGTTVEHQAHGYGSYIAPCSMQRVQVSWNSATGGQQVVPTGGTTNCLSVQIDDFLASSDADTTSAAVVMMGSNDIVTAPSTVASALLVQLKRLRPRKVYLCTIPPAAGTTNTSTATYDSAGTVRWQWIMRYNALIRQIARDHASWITLVDVHAIGVDSTSATAVAKTNYIYDSATTGLHTSNYYALLIGQAIASAATSGLPSQYDWTTSAADLSTLAASAIEPPTNVLSNGLITAGSGTGTGWTLSNGVSATHTPSIVSNPNGYGSCQQLAATMTAANDYVRASNSGWNTRLSNTDSIFGQVWVRLPADTVCAPRLYMSVVCGGVTYVATCFANTMNNAGANLPAVDMLVRTPILTLPGSGSITSADFQLTNFAKGAGTGDILFGQAEVRRIVSVS